MFNKTKSTLAATLSVAMLASMITIPASAATATQLSGKDRYETALKIVEAGWTKSENAIITTGEVMADALAAAPLAYAKGQAPILLTKTNAIPTGVLAELKALGVKNVYIVGGVGAVSKTVADELAAAGLTITRVSGDDRFATSLAVAKEAFGTTAPAEVVIANGISYADALTVSSIAAKKGMPILLVNNSQLSAEQKSYIAGKTVYAVGGTGVLNAAVVTETKATRLGGLDRYETNAAILTQFKPDYSKIYLAKGSAANLVDALAGSVLAAKTNSPVVLVNDNNTINAALSTVVKANITAASTTVLLGGTVTQAAATAIEALKAPVATALKVESVSAINYKQIKVQFNNAVDKDSAEDLTNYVVTDNSGANLLDGLSGSDLTAVAELQSDNKTVIITVESGASELTALKTNTVQVLSALKDAQGVILGTNYVNTAVTAVDTVIPTVQSVSITGPKTMKVQFSEPVDGSVINASDFQLDGGTIGLSSAISYSVSGSTVTINSGSNLSVGTHKLTVNANNRTAFADFAGFPVVKTVVNFDVAAVTTAPTVLVDSVKPNKVVLKFNRPVKNVDKATIYHGYSSNAAALADITPVSVDANGYSDTWNVVFQAGKYLPTGSVVLHIENDEDNMIADKWDNEMADITLATSTVADNVLPTVTSVSVENRKEIKVKFSEDVLSADATNKAKYTFKTTAGKVMTASDFADLTAYGHPGSGVTMTYDATNYTVTMSFANNFPTGDYSLTMSGIQDIATYTENKLASVTKSIKITNSDPATLQAAILDNNKIYMTFDKEMATSGTGSVLEVSNYQISKTGSSTPVALPTGSTLTLGDNSKEVVITLGSTTGISIASKIIANVYDSTNSAINGVANNQFLIAKSTSAITSSDIRKIKLIDKKTVTFEVTKPINGLDVSKVRLAADNTGANGIAADSVSYVNQTLSDGTYGSVVTVKVAGTTVVNTLSTGLVLTGDLDSKDTLANKTNNVVILAGGITNKFDVANAAINIVSAATTVEDIAAPYMVSTATKDNSSNGQIDQVVVTFSEAVYSPSVQDSDFTVDGYTVSGIASIAGNVVTLTVDEKGTIDTSAKPEVTIAGEVQDMSLNRNAITSQAAVVAADAVAPVAVPFATNSASFKVVNATTATIVFSEALDTTKFAVGTPLSGFSTNGTTTTSATLSVDGKTLTITGTGFVGATTTISFMANANVVDTTNNALASFTAVATH